jgi:hypothetical protein
MTLALQLCTLGGKLKKADLCVLRVSAVNLI